MIAESRMLSPEMALIFLNAANIMYVVCYAVRDVLWLRVFCVTAICTIMPYYLWGTGEVQMGCIWWNLLFLAINSYWIVVIIKQRQPPKMTSTQKQLYSDVFERSCSAQEMLKLLSAAKWIDFEAGQTVINKSSDPNGLVLIAEGTANVIVEKELVARLGRGDFVGEMSYLTGEPAVADVVASCHMKTIRWEKSELENVFDGRPELKSAINEIVGRDLVQKLVSSESKVPELSVDTVIG